jgi:hypothetical protein
MEFLLIIGQVVILILAFNCICGIACGIIWLFQRLGEKLEKRRRRKWRAL